MQFNTTPALIAVVDPAEMLRATGLTVNTVLIIIGISLVTSYFATWITSVILAKPKATMGSAAKLMVTQTAFCLIFVVLWAMAMVFLGAAQADGALVAIIMIGALIVFITVIISIPMQIYEIGAWRSIGFLLLSGAIAGGTFNIAMAIAARPLGLDKAQEKLQSQFIAMAKAKHQEVLGQPGQPNPEFIQRQTALQRRYEQLEIRRKYLPANDHKAFSEYERDRMAYERDLEELRAEFAP
jgi:multisubunit Na+/H+ antiporter MnhB subunit